MPLRFVLLCSVLLGSIFAQSPPVRVKASGTLVLPNTERAPTILSMYIPIYTVTPFTKRMASSMSCERDGSEDLCCGIGVAMCYNGTDNDVDFVNCACNIGCCGNLGGLAVNKKVN